MTQPQLAKLWSVLCAVLIYYAGNSWIVSQGGHEIFSAKLVSGDKVPAAMIAIPVCAILLAVCSLIGYLFARRGGPKWHERVPIVGFESIATSSTEAVIYQGSMMFFFSVFPAVSMIHFWDVFLSAKVMLNDRTNVLIPSVWDWSKLWTLNDAARICTEFIGTQPNPCVGDATVLPGLQPALFVGITAIALLAFLAHWCAVLTGPQCKLTTTWMTRRASGRKA